MRPSGATRPSQRPYNVAYYARNREAEIAKVVTRQRATLAWLRDLRRVPCADCGGTFPPYAMDFDHRDPSMKLFSLGASKGATLLKSRAVLEAEIAKCDIVCANCHRIRTQHAFTAGVLRPASFRRKRRSADASTQRNRDKVLARRREQAALVGRSERHRAWTVAVRFRGS